MTNTVKKLSLSGSKLTLGNIDPSKLRTSTTQKAVQVEVRRQDLPVKPVRELDTSAAVEAQDMIAGITEDDVRWGMEIARSSWRDNTARFLRRRTEVLGMIPHLILNKNGSSELSREMSAEMLDPNREITAWEKSVYQAAFPNYDDAHTATLCTPLGGRLILNWLSIFGMRSYADGASDLKELVEYSTLIEYWKTIYSLPDISVEPRPEPRPEPEKIAKMVLRTESTDRAQFKNRLLNDQRFMVICPLTKVTDTRFLIASHIKPFAACENRGERVDADNGFLLSPSADKLFDHGYITFTDEGVLMRSAKLGITGALLKSLGIDANAKVPIKSDRTRQYLAYHRTHVFEGERTKDKPL
jgi:hypothetical protein